MPAPLAQLKAISNFTCIGDLIGVKEGQFKNLRALEQHISTLSATANPADKTFLANFQKDVDKYKDRIIGMMVDIEAENNFKSSIESRTLVDSSDLVDAKLKVSNGFDQLRTDVDFVVGTLNDSLDKDEKIKKTRQAVGASVLHIIVGIAGLGVVGTLVTSALDPALIEHIKDAKTAVSELLTVALAAQSVQEVKQAKEEVKKVAVLTNLDASTHKSSIDFLQLIKNQTVKSLDQAKVEVQGTTLSNWDGELSRVHTEAVLTGNPNYPEAMVQGAVHNKMTALVEVARKDAVQAKLNELPPGIKKIMATATISEAKALEQEMSPFREYLHMRFIANNLASRDYNNPANKTYGYDTAPPNTPNLPPVEGHQLMTRVDKFRYFPNDIAVNNTLVGLSKPYVRTSMIKTEKIHKGGDNIRLALVNNISGIKENQESFGFVNDDSGKIKSKGTVEDTLRSYAIINELMQNPPLATVHTSTVPFFKSEDELVEVISGIMKYNVFFEPHDENNGQPLVTPLCVFNRDPHLKNLISNNDILKGKLHEVMTENNSNFILKCLTDPNIFTATSSKKPEELDNSSGYRKKLEETLTELKTLYVACGATPVEVEALNKNAAKYINAQCEIKGPLAKACADNFEKIAKFVPKDALPSVQKLQQAESMTIVELEAAIKTLGVQKATISAQIINQKGDQDPLHNLTVASNKILKNKRILAQMDPYAPLATPVSPSSTASVTISPPSSPSSTAAVTISPPSSPISTASVTISPPTSPTSTASVTISPPTSPTSIASATSSPAATPVSPSTKAPPPPPVSPGSKTAPPPPSRSADPVSPGSKSAPPPPATSPVSAAAANPTADFKKRMPKPPETPEVQSAPTPSTPGPKT